MASPPSDGHKGVVVQWQSAGTVQRVKQVGSLRPSGSSVQKHLAGHVRIPAAEKVDIPRGHGDSRGIDPWLVEVGVAGPRRG